MKSKEILPEEERANLRNIMNIKYVYTGWSNCLDALIAAEEEIDELKQKLFDSIEMAKGNTPYKEIKY